MFIISLSESKVLSSIKRMGGMVCAESNLAAQKHLSTFEGFNFAEIRTNRSYNPFPSSREADQLI